MHASMLAGQEEEDVVGHGGGTVHDSSLGEALLSTRHVRQQVTSKGICLALPIRGEIPYMPADRSGRTLGPGVGLPRARFWCLVAFWWHTGKRRELRCTVGQNAIFLMVGQVGCSWQADYL